MNKLPPFGRLRRRGNVPGFCIAALCLWALSGCERPFIEVLTPDIEILAPDLNIIQTEPTVTFEITASSFRDIDVVAIDGIVMERIDEEELWRLDVALVEGLSELFIEAIDTEGVSRVDTVYALRAALTVFNTGPRLPFERGMHAALRLQTGDVLVTGGAVDLGAEALPNAALFRIDSPGFVRMPESLQHARVGHTASLLPDGRVLILGGGTRPEIGDVSELVEEPEIYDPVTQTFAVVPVDGDPVRRMLHTATVRSAPIGPVVDLVGGRGDIQYTPNPRLGTRDDLRTFALVGDTLRALSPAVGATLPVALWGHTATTVRSVVAFGASKYLVSGTFFFQNQPERIGFTLDFTSNLGILTGTTGTLRLARTLHAGVFIQDDFVGILGGRQATFDSALASAEIYSGRADRYFQMPSLPGGLLVPRFGHSATLLQDGRILMVGGFSPSGTASNASELAAFSFR